ncbi:MAG: glycosyltransferase [Candidatus Nanopelagicales bacterium]
MTKGLGPGGMERLLVHHARTGDHRRFEYSAAYLTTRPNSVVAELESLGVRCTQLGDGGGADPRWVRVLQRLVRSHDIDVVHHHSPQPASMSRIALRTLRNGPSMVYTEHNTWDCYRPTTRVLNAVTYPLDEAQFAVSASVRESVPRVLRRGLEPLTHGIDLVEVRLAARRRADIRASLGVGPDDVVVANVAHLRNEKAQDTLMAAAAQLAGRFDYVTFLSVGHGPMDHDLRALHERLGLGDRFRFLGFREDALSVLAGSDVFCLSSRQEGLPVAFMEASALGVPTVATSVGGLPEHIDHGRSGLLATPNDPADLAAALGRVIADSALRQRLGAAASTHSEVFDARLAVRRQEAVYQQLQAKRRRS